MNWLDGVFVVVIAASAYLGLRTGLISAAFTAIGAWVGIVLAGRFSDDLGGWLTTSISNDTLVTVISFAFIVVASIMVARIAGTALRKAVGLFFLGFADPLAGAVLGALAGVILVGALITGMARLAYDFEPPVVSAEEQPGGDRPASEGEASQRGERVAYATLRDGAAATLIEDTRGFVEGPLLGSFFASAFVDVVDALPGEVLGFVPSDFKDALDILEVRIELQELQESQERSGG